MHQFPGGIHYMSATAVGRQEKNLRRGRNLQIRGIPAARMLILAIVASLQPLLSHLRSLCRRLGFPFASRKLTEN